MIKVGIIGAGHITNKMANTINQLPDFINYAIGSRSKEKAILYQKQYGFEKAYDSYEELVMDPNVDLVYIATPHSLHYEQMLLCLQHHKPVLCEKILTNEEQLTKDIFARFKAANLFLCEALWTSFLPSRDLLNELLFQEKIVGKIIKMEANFQKPLMHKERIYSKALGGGAMMDIGIYPLTMILRTFGFDYLDIVISDIEFYNEVDTKETIVIKYQDKEGICYIDATKGDDLSFLVYGDKGVMRVDSVNNPGIIELYDNINQLIKTIKCVHNIGGFEYELEAVKEALKSGNIECKQWSSANSILLSEIVSYIIDERK